MEKNNKDEELQSRRGFFKKAAKGALPFLVGAALVAVSTVTKASDVNDCNGACTGTCYGSCQGCDKTCRGTCYGSCEGTCNSTCRGTCHSACDGVSH